MKTMIFHIEDSILPDKVADIFFEYPNRKVLNKKGELIFCYSLIKSGDTIYIVHDLDAEIRDFLACVCSDGFDHETEEPEQLKFN